MANKRESGWGGARVGAGSKPKAEPLRVVPPQVSDESYEEAPDELTVPPDDLTPEQQEFWRKYAPKAIERKTLTDATVPAFRLLCELDAKKTMVGAMVDKGALGGLRVFMQLAKQVESLMGRFCLAPFGKPTFSEKPKKDANPWSKL